MSTSSGDGRKAASSTPLWLDAVRRFERAVGGPVERMVTSDTYFDALPHLRRAQAQLVELAAALTEEWYRLINLPTGNDVRRMREQLSRMERQLDRLTKQLAERDDTTP
jgi:ubiquinone biosynthesis protein UbiJ